MHRIFINQKLILFMPFYSLFFSLNSIQFRKEMNFSSYVKLILNNNGQIHFIMYDAMLTSNFRFDSRRLYAEFPNNEKHLLRLVILSFSKLSFNSHRIK